MGLIRATARPVFERVAARLAVDADLLAYLFSECLQEVLLETEASGSCTLRGHGKFKKTTLQVMLDEEKLPGADVTIFERSKHLPKSTPFATLRLDKRMQKSSSPLNQP